MRGEDVSLNLKGSNPWSAQYFFCCSLPRTEQLRDRYGLGSVVRTGGIGLHLRALQIMTGWRTFEWVTILFYTYVIRFVLI